MYKLLHIQTERKHKLTPFYEHSAHITDRAEKLLLPHANLARAATQPTQNETAQFTWINVIMSPCMLRRDTSRCFIIIIINAENC